MKICIVSPHLDDAILSCGILMQRRAAAGDEVFALNIFSAGTNAENRRREDERAQKKIGARAFFLDELDAPDRDARYAPLRSLFFANFGAEEQAVARRVAARISGFFDEHGIEKAWFPLAAGTHIDHRTVYEAGRLFTRMPVRYYEDRPYILWPGILRGRMNQIGCAAQLASGAGREATPDSMAKSVGAFHYHAHFVPEGDYRIETLPFYQAALKPPTTLPLRGTEETLIATEAELKNLYGCLSLYDSQMKFIYRDYDNFRADSAAYEQATSGTARYAERCWALAPA